MTVKRSPAAAALPIRIGGEAVYTAAQVQRLLGVCKATLRDARQRQGLVASRRFGRDWYFESDLLAFLWAGRCSRGGADAVEGAVSAHESHRERSRKIAAFTENNSECEQESGHERSQNRVVSAHDPAKEG